MKKKKELTLADMSKLAEKGRKKIPPEKRNQIAKHAADVRWGNKEIKSNPE